MTTADVLLELHEAGKEKRLSEILDSTEIDEVKLFIAVQVKI